mgnify:CR=1 FL=1
MGRRGSGAASPCSACRQPTADRHFAAAACAGTSCRSFLMARPLPALLACLALLLLAAAPAAHAAPRATTAASAGRTFAAAARSVDAGGRLTVTGALAEWGLATRAQHSYFHEAQCRKAAAAPQSVPRGHSCLGSCHAL